ncbi:MAG: Hpt domain-containing protein [Oscillospiraceae bacterium]
MSDDKEILFDKARTEEGYSDEDKLGTLRRMLPEIDVNAGLAVCGGDKSFYLEMLGDFTKLPIRAQLTKCLLTEDYKNYCIRIHGFKSNAKYIGAAKLGELAFEMEKLTRDELPENIYELQDSLFEQYDRICRGYCKIMDIEYQGDKS